MNVHSVATGYKQFENFYKSQQLYSKETEKISVLFYSVQCSTPARQNFSLERVSINIKAVFFSKMKILLGQGTRTKPTMRLRGKIPDLLPLIRDTIKDDAWWLNI